MELDNKKSDTNGEIEEQNGEELGDSVPVDDITPQKEKPLQFLKENMGTAFTADKIVAETGCDKDDISVIHAGLSNTEMYKISSEHIQGEGRYYYAELDWGKVLLVFTIVFCLLLVAGLGITGNLLSMGWFYA